MRFNDHYRLAGKHALLSPSTYSWVNYDEQKVDAHIWASLGARRGTELHALACQAIKLGVKLPDTNATLNAYVNDCIGFRLTPEQILYYSDNCYGCADACGFRKNKLQIFDLKTGITRTSVKQLEIYAALFCLEYKIKPTDIEIELRIYQNDEVRVYDGDPVEITRIMDQIVFFDRRIEELRMEAYG